MEFMFVCLLLATSVTASPLTDNQRSRSETTVKYHADVSDSPTLESGTMVRDVIYSSPALVFVGTQDKLLRCRHDDPTECEVWFEGVNSTAGSLLTFGAHIYAGLYSGVILRCDLYQKDSCKTIHTGDLPVESLAIANGYFFAGLFDDDGMILRCQLHKPNICRPYRYVGSPVFSLMQFNDYLVAGLKDGRIVRCSIIEDDDCSVMYEDVNASSIMGIVSVENTVLTIVYNGWLYNRSRSSYEFDDYSIESTNTIHTRDLVAFNEALYIPEESKKVTVCKLRNITDCSDYGNFGEPWSIAFAYGTYVMQRLNSNTDIGRSPLVPHHDAHVAVQTTGLETHVKDGKLYNSEGSLLDTADYDASLAGAPNFMMSPDGTILLSKPDLIQNISSLFPGKLVSSAGEMIVRNGKIKEISTCVEHFVDLNQQVITSLRVQGYMDPVYDSGNCVVRMTGWDIEQ